ncbi:D-2-hydroxyacid dehydrogenase [Desulfuromonas acetoxidans]|uniref:D-2-hydroxyacid dehydrogenase n=1 Tax=Desulfuromonas acetoxidans TaxID=891 RepID=UPI0037485492
MNIVVLDGHTLNSGDLDWAPLQALGTCEIYPRTAPGQIVERARDAEIVLTNKVVLGEAELLALPKLRYIGVLATGTNVVDLDAAARRQIVVTNVPAYSTMSVAQMVFSLLLELVQQVGHHDRRVHDGGWSDCEDFSFRETPLMELDGLTLGIVGFGHIGRAVARIGESFGMNVLVHVRRSHRFKQLHEGNGPSDAELDHLFAQSDVVSLHCPLTEQTHHLVDERRLALMKPGAILINTARGPLLDEVAVAKALQEGHLGGLGVDVLSSEPPSADNPLLTALHCVITPHIAWATLAARQRLLETVVANVAAYQAGTPQNVVN